MSTSFFALPQNWRSMNSRGNSRGVQGAAEVNGGINNRRSLYSRGVLRTCVRACVFPFARHGVLAVGARIISHYANPGGVSTCVVTSTPTNITRSCVSALPRFERGTRAPFLRFTKVLAAARRRHRYSARGINGPRFNKRFLVSSILNISSGHNN